MSSAVIVGFGLVSPLGLGATEHAFYLRASVGAPPPPAFETADGRPVRARHCGFLGASLGMAERLSRMAEIAAHQALSPWEAASQAGPFALAFVAPRRAGILAADVAEARSHAARRCGASVVQTWVDAAGAFAALEQAGVWLSDGSASAVLLMGVDSFIHPDALAEDLEHGDSPWCPRRPPASEGAAALLLTRPERARALGLSGARVRGSGTAVGKGTDEDDAILDGAAMTALLRGLPARRIDLVAGQEKVDDLRQRDWHLARAREASRFAEEAEAVTLEDETGRLGAAAGVACAAFGVGALQHGIFRGLSPTAHLVAWAISRDGTRGAALVQGGVG